MLHRSYIFLILFLALFGGGIISLGAPRHFSFAIDLLVAGFFIFSLFARAGKGLPVPHLWHFFFAFLFVTFFSIFVNESPPKESIFSLRLIYRFYIFYLALIIMQPDDRLIKTVNLFIVFLLVMQFPVVAVKFPLYGIDERTAGAYAVHDGSIATTLPISFIFYLAAFYFIYKPKTSYLTVGFGYIVLSILGAKRAIFYLYPFQFLAIYYYIYVKGTGAHISKKIIALLTVAPFIIVLSGSILYLNRTLSPDREVSGQIDFRFALEYLQRYSYGVDGYGYSFGRVATTIRVIEILKETGVSNVFFGIGPGSTAPSFLLSKEEREAFDIKYESFKISYGFTTMNRIGLEYGLVGVLIFSGMLYSLVLLCIKLYRKESEPYWRAFAAGSVCFSISMLFFAFAYHWTAFWGDTMPVLYFYAMAVAYTRYHHRPVLEKNYPYTAIGKNAHLPITA